MFFNRTTFVMAAIVVIAAACGGNGEGLVETPVAHSARIEPTSTVDPSPTSVAHSTEVRLDERLVVDLATLVIPVCRTDSFTGDPLGFGTIPRVLQSSTSFQSDLLDPESEIIVALAPVIRWLGHFIPMADIAWEQARSEKDFAAAISDESRRLWLSCSAVANATHSLEAENQFSVSVSALLEKRRQWLTERLEVLRTNPVEIRDDDENRLTTSVALKNLSVTLDEFAAEHRIEDRVASVSFSVPNPLLGLSIEVPGGWVPIRNRIDIVLVAPSEVQMAGLTGLGVPGWNFGTALHVRRLGHESPWTLSDSAELLDSLMTKFGDRSTDERRQIGGIDAVIRVYESPEDEWVTIVAATVRDLHTYLFEFGCPLGELEFCRDTFAKYLTGVQFNAG